MTALLDLNGVPESQHGAALISIDKLGKVQADVVIAELAARGMSRAAAAGLLEAFTGHADTLGRLQSLLGEHEQGASALTDLGAIVQFAEGTPAAGRIRVDPSLARGLSYYTGTIMEIAVPDLAGSLGGGGRYDNLIGLFLGIVGSLVFNLIGLPYYFIVGSISGILSLVPYFGVLLALVPPLVVGIGQVSRTDIAVIVATVVGLHLFAFQVLYPKLLGRRLALNPLAVTLSLLMWGSLWGPWGLVLALPITAMMKIVFDHVERLRPFGDWLGE